MTRLLRVCLWVSLSALTSAPSVLAQLAPAPDATPPPAHLSVVEGQVFLDREGRSEPAVENVPLLDGDRIRTERGRAEIMLGDGSLLHIDEGTTADVLAGDLIRLLQGRLIIVVIGARNPSRAVVYQLDAPAASVQTNGPGEYRVTAVNAADANTTELAVVRGDATFANDVGSVNVRAGERSMARDGEAPGQPQYFNSARWDEFDRWSAARREAQLGSTSAYFLPQDLEPYSRTFDRYGTWRIDESSGYVWFPTVSADWRPYSVGYWRQYDQWDSFWIAGDPWGWPTHHYGRWGFSVRHGWYWIPARSWAPSFVYWALGGDYVSWCPLGWNDSPVFGHWGVPGVYGGLHNGWPGWTVIPRRHFGSPVFASHVAVDPRRLDSQTRSAFVAGRRSPEVGHAVPRGRAITATARTEAAPPSSGPRGAGLPGRGDRAQQRSAISEAPRAEMRGQTERPQRAEARSPQAAPAPGPYLRRTVPGAPAGGGPNGGISATERQAQQSGWSSGQRSDPAAASGSAERVGRRPLPEAAPRVPGDAGERASARQRSAGPTSGERLPVPSSSPRLESRPMPRAESAPAPRVEYRSMPRAESAPAPRVEYRSMPGGESAPAPRVEYRSMPRAESAPAPRVESRPMPRVESAPAPRVESGPTSRSAPDIGPRPEPSPSAAPRPAPSPGGGPAAPSSRYNPGSATQPPPSRGTSPPGRGRGGRPE